MSYQDLLNARVRAEVVKTPAVHKALGQSIKEKEREYSKLRLHNVVRNPITNIRNPVSKLLNSRLRNKKIVRASSAPVIVENQPIVLQDRSRFFADEVQEDRRQLFFR